MAQQSLEKSKIRILLLEGVDQNAVKHFRDMGYQSIEYIGHALDQQQLQTKMLEIEAALEELDGVNVFYISYVLNFQKLSRVFFSNISALIPSMIFSQYFS